MEILPYDREAAVLYARRWAFARNPAYYNFDALGGDCTNFASQCLYAGTGVQNCTPVYGWYYQSVGERAPAWTGVPYFYQFLLGNAGRGGQVIGEGQGPFAEQRSVFELEIGDFVQLGRENGEFYHTLIVVGFYRGVPLLAAHTNDAYNRPLTLWNYAKARGLHILGVRTE